ncbi:transcriptional activator hac1 [Verruconis gallopava]|uniref:Transcriptional activator hac1 n=1 Tax=Verruconis gallopava TaxID=253628 RepID=A0A0D2ANI4_9PEZI|nr:transcriptional activator hac1 [Verruconis gallopava]KIW08045.1 transcriptional activator hac1 [Verruconis gallopava]
MEATHNTLQIIQNYVKTPSIQVEPPKTIKMEDITATPSTSSSSLLDLPPADSVPKPAESKPVKKRKSWGQVLPEPKTSLPPRKRAKTADEKEQRRIERVKRNRLAAHNSRERKRQEVEALSERNALLERHLKLMQQQLDTYRAMYPDANIPPLPKIDLERPASLAPSLPNNKSTPAPTTQFIHEVSTPAPLSSPDSLLSNIDSPVDTAPSTPRANVKEEFDRTQQSAALLCKTCSVSRFIPSQSRRQRLQRQAHHKRRILRPLFCTTSGPPRRRQSIFRLRSLPGRCGLFLQ